MTNLTFLITVMLLLLSLSECRYVAIDLAGHGLSSHRPPGVLYSFPYYVMDVRRVIDGEVGWWDD